jgi:hypothetical protein
MPVIERLSSLIAKFRPQVRPRSDVRGESGDNAAAEPPFDPAKEALKIQRWMRRLGLASDRSGEMLHSISARLDEVQQRLVNMNRPQQAALDLDEARLLHILDQLDRLAGFPQLPAAADSLIRDTKSTLLNSARWQPIAVTGARPGGNDIRVAEYLIELGADDTASASPCADVHILRILEQGYRRADGSLLRPGVVIAAAAPHGDHSLS